MTCGAGAGREVRVRVVYSRKAAGSHKRVEDQDQREQSTRYMAMSAANPAEKPPWLPQWLQELGCSILSLGEDRTKTFSCCAGGIFALSCDLQADRPDPLAC